MLFKSLAKTAFVAAFASVLCLSVSAQVKSGVKKRGIPVQKAVSNLPKVTQIDIDGLKKLIKPNGKPLMINFWATWCDPCREEFPDLVKLDTTYKGKLDIVTISLDDLAEINRDVPKFLVAMKAVMPAYLLRAIDEDAAMKIVTPDWAGNLPMTIIFAKNGDVAYLRKGKIHLDAVTAEIEKVLTPSQAVVSSEVKLQNTISVRQIVDLPVSSETRNRFGDGVADAQRDIALGKYKVVRFGLTAVIPEKELERLQKTYSLNVVEHGCVMFPGDETYINGYNTTVISALKKKFGERVATEVAFAKTSPLVSQ